MMLATVKAVTHADADGLACGLEAELAAKATAEVLGHVGALGLGLAATLGVAGVGASPDGRAQG
jgi:hypothetical protein